MVATVEPEQVMSPNTESEDRPSKMHTFTDEVWNPKVSYDSHNNNKNDEMPNLKAERL